MKKKVLIPKGGAKPLAPYSPGIQLGNLIFTSGQIGIEPNTGKLVSGGVKAETRQALENLQKILVAGRSSLDQVVKISVILKDINSYGVVNEIYGEYFEIDPPARSIIQGELPIGAAVEFDAIAFID